MPNPSVPRNRRTESIDEKLQLLRDAYKSGRYELVESIADSYIAVTGLPEADPLHAVRMAQFASDCLQSFAATTERLERSLGPDTGELQLRVGLHSGPVTAGVLKGERSRFQLFGNTCNIGTFHQHSVCRHCIVFGC